MDRTTPDHESSPAWTSDPHGQPDPASVARLLCLAGESPAEYCTAWWLVANSPLSSYLTRFGELASASGDAGRYVGWELAAIETDDRFTRLMNAAAGLMPEILRGLDEAALVGLVSRARSAVADGHPIEGVLAALESELAQHQ